MSEGRKKNRKSKLEVREDCDYDQHTEPDLQRYLKLLKADHDYTSVDHLPEPIQLSIKVEVEEFDGNIPYEAEPFDAPSTSRACFDDDAVKSVFQHVSTLKRYGNRGLCKKISYSVEKILQTAEYTVSISPTIANKILNVSLRNLVGSYIKEDCIQNAYDIAVKNALLEFPSFCKVANIRDPPLFYQCYICRLSWWHYYPFRDHIIKHPIKNLKILFEYEKTVCYLIATNTLDVKIEYIETEGECFRCGNNFEFHLKNKDNYKCSSCFKVFSNCNIYKQHDGSCENKNFDDRKYCVICHYYISGSEVTKHFLQVHVVRSDMVVPVINRFCSLCKQVYHLFAYHVCSKSGMRSNCSSCKRKFPTRKLAELHEQTNLSNIACDLCNTVLAKKCSEIDHMLFHTDLFKMVYKCAYCNDIFVDEDSVRLHRIHKHKYKSDKRGGMQLAIPVPERCTREDAIEKIDYSRPKSNADLKRKKSSQKTKINAISTQYNENSQVWSNYTFGGNSSQEELSQNSSVLKDDENIEYDHEKSNIFEDDKTNIEIVSHCVDPSNFDDNLSKSEEPMSNIEVTVETEPMDYDEILSNVFKVSPEVAEKSNVFQMSNNVDNFESTVKIKTEPLDENEITENANVQNDHCYYLNNICDKDNSQNSISQDDLFSIGVTVKEEVFNQFEEENLIIKTEAIDEEYYTNYDHEDFCIDVKKSPVSDRESRDFNEKSPDVTSKQLPVIELKKSPVFFEKSPDVEVRKSPVFDIQKNLVFEETSSDIDLDIKEEPNYYTPEVEYGDSDDELLTLAFDENPYPCSKCNNDFKSCRDYIIHLRLSHALPEGICPCCGDKEERLGRLVQHLEKHVRHSYVRMKCLSKNFKAFKCINSCRVCHKKVSKVDYFKHWEKHAYHSNMKLELKTFKQEEECSNNADRKMKPEMLATTLKQLISSNDLKTCCVCQRAFSRRADTKRHLIEHLLSDAHVKREVTKTLRCQHCFEEFHKPDQYKFHMRDHGGLTIYRCEICQKTFSDSSNFAKHSKVHNVSVLICDLCNKKFNAKSSLERHMIMIHQNSLKNFPCNICNAICYTSLERKRHIARYHKEPSYKCHICNIVFHNLRSKWDHEWASHRLRKYQADCPICNISFRKFSDVKRHAKHAHGKLITLRNSKDGVIYRDVALPARRTKVAQRASLLLSAKGSGSSFPQR